MGAAAGKAATNIAKAGAKLATTGALTWAFPIFGPFIAGAINSLYAEGGDIQTINDKIKDIAPDDAKFKTINTPEQLKQLIIDFPKETKAAGLTAAKIDKGVAKYEEQKTMAKGGMVSKKGSPPIATMAKGDMAKVKKERSPAQKAATAKMLAALKASKGKK
jgi:hypothetical protein